MPSYTAPTRDTRFIINEMLDLESYAELPGFEAASADVTDAVMNAQQNLQAAIAIRDKIVTAFLEISRMQI